MPRSVNPPATAPESSLLEEFFVGLAEARAYLERHLQDPSRRHARLARIARDIVRPRPPEELAQWLAASLCEAMGARGCSVLVAECRTPGQSSHIPWQRWAQVGNTVEEPPNATLGAIAEDEAAAPVRWVENGVSGLLVRIPGAEARIAALWLEGVDKPDEETSSLVQAIAETTRVVLEQGLRLSELSKDPVTGVLIGSAFAERAGLLLADPPHEDQLAVLIGFRVAGMEALRAAWGNRAAQNAARHLVQAVRNALPQGALLGALSDDIFVLLRGIEAGSAEVDVAVWARNTETRLQSMGGEAGPSRASLAAYAVLGREIERDQLNAVMQRISRQLDGLRAGGLSQVE